VKNIRRILSSLWILGFALFGYIVSQLDLSAIVTHVRQFRLSWLCVCASTYLLSAIFKAARWRVALIAQGSPFSFFETLAVSFKTSFLGTVTPGRLGDLSRVGYLYRSTASVSKSLVTVFLDRLYDIAFLLLFGLLAVVYFLNLFVSHVGSFLLLLLTSAGIGILAMYYRMQIWRLFKQMLRGTVSVPMYEALILQWDIFRNEVRRVFRASMSKMIFFTLLSYIFYFVQVFAITKGYGLEIPIAYVVMCASLSALVSMLPITVGGVGTREAVFVLLLGRASVSSEAAVLVSFTDGVVFLILFGATLALAVSMAERLGRMLRGANHNMT